MTIRGLAQQITKTKDDLISNKKKVENLFKEVEDFNMKQMKRIDDEQEKIEKKEQRRL